MFLLVTHSDIKVPVDDAVQPYVFNCLEKGKLYWRQGCGRDILVIVLWQVCVWQHAVAMVWLNICSLCTWRCDSTIFTHKTATQEVYHMESILIGWCTHSDHMTIELALLCLPYSSGMHFITCWCKNVISLSGPPHPYGWTLSSISALNKHRSDRAASDRCNDS